jgi:hypothetical protein
MSAQQNVFAAFAEKAWPITFHGRLRFRDLAIGGTPTDDKVATAWIKSKFISNDEAIRKLVAETMAEREVDAKAALEAVGDLKLLKGFKKDATGLFYDARCLKACIKEGVAVASSAEKIDKTGYGAYSKAGVRSFVAEHIFVAEQKVHLLVGGKPVMQHHGIQQRFVTTWRGKTGITYEEYVDQAEIAFTVKTDWEFSEAFWAMVWLTAGEQGLGATRSQSFGRFDVVAWDRVVSASKARATRARKAA